MSDSTEAKTEAPEPPPPPKRRPWHAPRFICTDVSATDTMCNAANDGPTSLS